ncbi:MAG: BREX-1 system adenine-specific DNA-methyltransferase PglX [Syntrophomonadaceae bacterium]|nr:BREX-1 system adenine-specific DNA-methyltransferase PglX [Syntrophomonadaceae bacterium]MDD4548560.1 BREX-1 system adenine-specific DNA-methyltransferase PglX [Syntrophomonadaceae bacterium]
MNKTAIKNFAIWARKKLIADITYKAGLLGVTENGIKNPLPQSTKDVQFFDIGTKEPYSITGVEIKQRRKLVETIQQKERQSDYETAYKGVVEEVAYTWFNRLIAVRFMEVNDYLPSRMRVLSSESSTKIEPDLVTSPFEADLEYTPYEKDRIMQLKNDNYLDKLFCMLFIKQCNELNKILPELFEKTNDYTELLMNVSFTDKDGIVYHLVHDILEDDFNVEKEGQVEIIGWMYQYYNTELKDETFALLKKNVKITKERIPAATQLFTPHWIVRYMVENSLGRLWLEGHPNDALKSEWKYYLDEAEQEPEVQAQFAKIREEYKIIKPEDIKFIDPCMGSGHILVYAFEVLVQIYESCGYSQRDAAKSILENNLYGLDIDNRAYQLAYFAVMMKARRYNRRILNGETKCNLYAIQESNEINRVQLKYFGADIGERELSTARFQMQGLLDTFTDAKEYGSILNVENYNWQLLYQFVENVDMIGQMALDTVGIDDTKNQLRLLVEIGATMAQKYDVVVTNPPYMGSSGMGIKLSDFVKKNYPDSKSDLFAVFIERCGQMTKKNCYQAMITQHAWMFLSSFEKLREKILQKDIINMAHLGARAFEEIGGEVVQTTSYILRNTHSLGYQGNYIRLVKYGSQQGKQSAFLKKKDLHTSKQENFFKIPGMPIAYWLSKNIFTVFSTTLPFSAFAEAKSGLSTTDNTRFLRKWFEVSARNIGWNYNDILETEDCKFKFFPHNKGGSYRKWFGNNEWVVNWYNNGQEIRKAAEGASGGRIVNSDMYFKEGFTWSDISTGDISVRRACGHFIFDSSGLMGFAPKNDINYIIGLMNSKPAMSFLAILAPSMHFNPGTISKLPIIKDDNHKDFIVELVRKNINISKKDWDSFETSWDFEKHLLNGTTVQSAFENWQKECDDRFNQLKANEEELNRIFIEIYGLKDELSPEVDDKDVTVARIYDSKEDIPESMKGNNYVLTKSDVIKSFISYAVGCMFGRYSLDVDGLVYAGGEWDDSKYSTFIPDKDNILPITDEEYFEDDVVGLFCAFLKKTFGADTLEENLDFIANALGNKGNSSREIIRNYFLKDFFKDHCKIYKKRPIYWMFDSGKADGFKALIYMHRYNADTIGNLRIDYLHRMQRVYESEISRMQETIEKSTNAREVTAAQKRKEKLTKQLKETKDYDEKIAHLALARIAFDSDDGVKVNYEKVQTGTDGKKLKVLAKI